MYNRTIVLAVGLLFGAAAYAAVDTADKRGSSLNMTGFVLPLPNSAVGAGDRGQLLKAYRGFEDPVTPIDNTRASIVNMWTHVYPDPDSDLDLVGDRMQMAYVYRDITAGSSAAASSKNLLGFGLGLN